MCGDQRVSESHFMHIQTAAYAYTSTHTVTGCILIACLCHASNDRALHVLQVVTMRSPPHPRRTEVLSETECGHRHFSSNQMQYKKYYAILLRMSSVLQHY